MKYLVKKQAALRMIFIGYCVLNSNSLAHTSLSYLRGGMKEAE